MAQPSTSFKVFLYGADGDIPALRALRSRLAVDGVSLPDDVDQGWSRKTALRDAILESDMALIVLSGDVEPDVLDEIKLVVGTAAQKPQGELFVLPIRFEKCDLPDVLKRWSAVDMFEQDGYEKLMLALKLRAERRGFVLHPRPGWKAPLQLAGDGKDDLEEEVPVSRGSWWIVGAAVLVAVLLMLWTLPGIFKAATKTAVPVNIMVENSTQYALEEARNISMTQTAVMQTVRAPITQTAAMEETLQHPATSTLQFPTIIALPTEIIDPGNIRMVYVPGDNFLIGNEFDTTGENPIHTLYVKPFYIDKYEVTNGLYRVCVDVGACEPPRSVSSETHPAYYGNNEFNNHPVVNVDWNMAKQYCKWRGARLPGEAEWEKAARSIDGRTYPWGEESGCPFANYADASGVCAGDTTVVGTYQDGRSLYGAFDMSGNVSEWVNSLYWTYPYSFTDGREVVDARGLRVVRGGSWFSPLNEITTFYRSGIDPSAYDLYTGFRCAHDAGL
jgi:formylglycine-generating enzyme required for sulfatase activity